MRKIADIKESIVEDFMRNADIARAYGFNVGDNFAAHFSKVSVESVLFHIFASAAWVLENLFDEHKKEVSTRIEEILPHRPKWYRDKVLNFMKDKVLIEDTDRYNIDGMNDADIDAAKVVKHAVAVENKDASMLTIKVAGGGAEGRRQLDDATEQQLAAYIAEIKDAGVRINLVNEIADIFHCEVDVYYNPMRLPDDVEAECQKTIKNYIENLPFNGEYTNMELVDKLQQVEGVKVVEFKGATTVSNSLTTPINARYIPMAGYFAAGVIKINLRSYE